MASLRLSSLLVLAAVGFQALGCSGDPASPFESTQLEALDEEGENPEEEVSDPIKTQAPPIKVMFADQQNNLIGMVATNTAIGNFASQTEYWNSRTDLFIDGDLGISATPLTGGETESDILGWLAPLEPSFDTPRLVRIDDWQRGQASIPTGMKPYLFETAHPDDASDVLGILIVVEPSTMLLGELGGKLAGVAWYRTSAPPTDGSAFRKAEFSGRLTLVLDRDGQPSADPRDIKEDADWHHIVMPMR